MKEFKQGDTSNLPVNPKGKKKCQGALVYALGYLKEGFSVIRIRIRDKKPIGKWKAYQSHQPDRKEVEKWFSSKDVGIGIVCGCVSGGLVVFDFDGKRWQDVYEEFLISFPRLSGGRMVETGSGKRHLWVKVKNLPEDLTRLTRTFDGAQAELRANEHCVVAPPSIHPSGKQYRFLDAKAPIAELSKKELNEITQWFGSNSNTEDVGMRSTKSFSVDTDQGDAAADYYLKQAILHAQPGNRNDTGFGLGCQLRDNGLSEEEAKPFIQQYAVSVPQGDQPYTADEALATLRSAYKCQSREPALPRGNTKGARHTKQGHLNKVPLDDHTHEILVGLSATDAGNAESFRELFGDKLCYVAQMGKWFEWDGVKWTENNGTSKLFMIETVRRRGQVAKFSLNLKMSNWALASESNSKINAALSLARAMLKRNHTDFDLDPHLLGCGNGMLDLRTGKLRPARPEDLLHHCTKVHYDPTAKCERWKKFLEEVFLGDKEVIDFIQRAVGYTITGDTSEQCLFILYGVGANGKSTLLSILEDLLGEYAITSSPSTFKEHRMGEVAYNDLARMRGKRLVKSIEVKEGAPLNEERIKAITGNDRITARFLYREFFEFTPTFKLWLAVNHKPTIRGTDEAIWRRIRLIPIEAYFPPERRDLHLKEKLRKELPGILAWAVRGCLEWQKRGLEPVGKIKRATEAYRTETDVVGQFIEECTVRKPNGKVRASKLYEAYKQWCEESGEQLISATAFGWKLREKVVGKRKVKGLVYYTGIGMLTENGRNGG